MLPRKCEMLSKRENGNYFDEELTHDICKSLVEVRSDVAKNVYLNSLQ